MPDDSVARVLRSAPRKAKIVDYHSHPNDEVLGWMGPSPSTSDMSVWGARYPDTGRDYQFLIAQPPKRATRATNSKPTAFSSFETQRPQLMSRTRAEDVRYELQRALARGRFGPEIDELSRMGTDMVDPAEYADSFEPLSRYFLQRHDAVEGRGSSRVELPRSTFSPYVADQDFLDTFTPKAMDILRSKGFAGGGGVLGRLSKLRSVQARLPEGGYSDMAQRLLDRAPATFDAYRAEPLARSLEETYEASRGWAGSNPDVLKLGTPASFLRLAYPVDWRDPHDAARRGALRQMLRTRQSNIGPGGENQYYHDLHPEFDGFGDVPFLGVTEPMQAPKRVGRMAVLNSPALPSGVVGQVTGHEGRHRMGAILDEYGMDAPIAVRVFGRGANSPFWMPQYRDLHTRAEPAFTDFATGGPVAATKRGSLRSCGCTG
jgi:hypothetical protein